MIFAAGLGTRLKPITDSIPKALVPICGKPLILWQIEKLSAMGCTELVVNVHHFADMLEEYLKAHIPTGMTLHISDERLDLLDTGGGLKKAAPFLSEATAHPILIHNVDILSNAPLLSFYQNNQNNEATLLVSSRATSRYLLFNNENCLVGWINIKTSEIKTPYKQLDLSQCQRYAFSGIHLFSPRLFPLMESWPNKFSIIDFYLSVCKEHRIYADIQPQLKLLDVGKQDTLAAAEEFVKTL